MYASRAGNLTKIVFNVKMPGCMWVFAFGTDSDMNSRATRGVLIQLITYVGRHASKMVVYDPGSRGVLPYIGYTGMCRWKGYGSQAIGLV